MLNKYPPDQLAIFEGCNTIIGHIFVENNYSGDFILNGGTEFRENISTEAPEHSCADPEIGLVTECYGHWKYDTLWSNRWCAFA